MDKTVKKLFKENLMMHQKNLSANVNKYCLIGGFIGVGFYFIMKITGIMSGFKWNYFIYFCIPVLFNTSLMALSNWFLKKKEDRIYVNTYKYILVLVACINYFAIAMFVPYRDTWGIIILVYFVSAYYLDLKVALFGIIISSSINIISFYYGICLEQVSTSLPDLLTRIQVLSFGSSATLISAILGRVLLRNSSMNEYNLNKSLEDIQKVNLKIKDTVSILKTSSEHISELSKVQYTGAETSTASLSTIAEETVNTTNNVNECVSLINGLQDDTVTMKARTCEAIDNSQRLKKTAVVGASSIETAVDKIINIKESAIKTFDSAKSLDENRKQIQGIVQEIQDISKQTHMLSLNASIEAARAGEAGAGFTVVAEAIRKLSDQSQKSLANINSVITSMGQHDSTVSNLVENVDEGVTIINKLNEYYNTIIENIENAIYSLDVIDSLANKQENSVSMVNNYIKQVKDMSDIISDNIQETSAATQQTFASCEELLDSAKNLNNMSKDLSDLVLI